MDRREFLITTGGVAVATASSAAVSAAESRVEPRSDAVPLRLSMPWTDAPHGPADSARRLAQRFVTMTDGRYRIDIETATGDGSPASDLVFAPAHSFSGLHPAFAYFGGLPGASGLAAQDFAHWLSVGGGQMLWDDLAAQNGMKPLLAGHTGEAPPLWSLAPITGLGDLRGQRVAVGGLGADVARALGADVVSELPHDAAAIALGEGTVFAAEAGGALQSLASGVQRSARYATGQGFNSHGTALALSVKLDVWERLPDAEKAILTAAAAEEFQLSIAEARAHAAIARNTLEGAFSVTFAPWPTDVAEAIERVAEAAIAHVAGHDAVSARIDHSYMAFRGALAGVNPTRRVTPSV